MREAYRRYFQSNGAVPQLTTWQLERFFTAYNTGDPVLELTMELLETDFHNLFTDAIIQTLQRHAQKWSLKRHTV